MAKKRKPGDFHPDIHTPGALSSQPGGKSGGTGSATSLTSALALPDNEGETTNFHISGLSPAELEMLNNRNAPAVKLPRE